MRKLEQLQARKAEIETRKKEIETEIETADLEKMNDLQEEVRSLVEEFETLKANIQVEERKNEVLQGFGKMIEKPMIKGEKDMNERKILNTPEYRSAFEKYLEGAEFTQEERSVVTLVSTMIDGQGGLPFPTQYANEVWDLVHNAHPILGDIDVIRSGTVLTIAVHKANAQGKAKQVVEGQGNQDAKEVFASVTLAGKEFTKHFEMSFTFSKFSNLVDYLKQELAVDLAEQLANYVVTEIKTAVDATKEQFQVAKFGVDVLNKALAKIKLGKKGGKALIYCNNATYYTYIANLYLNSEREKVAVNDILRTEVVIDEAIADNEFLVGNGKNFVLNVAQDLLINKYQDNKTFKQGLAGLILAEGKLVNDKAFVLVTKQG